MSRYAEGRTTKRYLESHKAIHLHTPEAAVVRVAAMRNSKKYKSSRLDCAKALHTAEAKARSLASCMASPLRAEKHKKLMAGREKSEKCQKGIKNHAAKMWHLRSPENIEHHFINLCEFIRCNQNLFNEEDIHHKALKGIGMLRPTNRKKILGSWKGWTWISYSETFTNGGKDLLSR